ncbi:MAG: hypothetical protein IJ088_00615 [Clostridia bacterium]|nr:hypothetical protein [Clostridia bacterium]
MSAADEVANRIDQYLEEIDRVKQKAKPGAGLFGIGVGPKDDPCNDRFLTDMQSWFERFAQSEPSSEEVEEVMDIAFTAQQQRQDFVFFTLIAIHGMALPLVQRLLPEAAERQALAYEERVPRNQRMPVQMKLLDELYRRAGRQPRKRGLFGRR